MHGSNGHLIPVQMEITLEPTSDQFKVEEEILKEVEDSGHRDSRDLIIPFRSVKSALKL